MRRLTPQTDRRPWRRGVWLGGALFGACLVASACGPFCRDIETRPLDIMCIDGDRFTGEIHFDSRPAFDTFLGQQCMPGISQGEIDRIADAVDWDTEAVFVTVGPNAIGTRCIEQRQLDKGQVCDHGLKVYFDDVYGSATEGCPEGRWTVAFVLDRADLRAALAAGDNVQ